MYLVLLIAITKLVARPCTNLDQDQIVFTAKSNEILTMDLSEIFDESTSNQYELNDDSKRFIINPPIQLAGQTVKQELINPILDFRVLKNEFNEWQNIFGVLVTRGDTYYFYKTIIVDETINYRLPTFNSEQFFHTTSQAIYSEFLFIDPNTILIDCVDEDQGVTKYFFELWSQTTNVVLDNEFPYDKTQPRHMLNSPKYIYRWAPKTNQHSAIIQVYQLNLEAKTINLVKTIDQAFMQELVKQIPNYQFELVELQVSTTDEMAFIDSQGYFIILQGDLQTLSAKIIQLNQQQPHSFDYNFKEQDLVVAFESSLEYVYNNEVSIIPFPNLSSFKVHLYQPFALLVNNQQIIQLDGDFKEIYRINGDFTQAIFDYDSNDFVVIQNQNINHYLLYPQFRLQYKSDKEKEDDWSKSTIKKGDCQLNLVFRNVEQTSKILYQYGSIPLISSALYSQNTEQPINRLVHGPNIKTELKQQGFVTHKVKVDLKYQQSQQLEIILDNVIFTNVYTNDELSQQKINYIINQTEDLKIHLLSCSNKIPAIACQQKIEFAALISLQNVTPVFHFYNQVLQIIYLNGLDLIIHTIKIENTQYKQQQTAERLKEEYAITQITNNDQYLLLFSPEKKLISVYEISAIDDGELYLIDATNVKIHTLKDWSPATIYANEKSNWVYINSQGNVAYVYVIELHIDHFRFIFSEQIRSVETKILIFKNQFGVLQQELNKSIYLFLFGVDHTVQIQSERLIRIDDYESITNLQSFYASPYNSAMYVQVNSTTLMVYFTEETSHNSLINIIEIDAKQIICSQSYIYLFQSNSSSVIEVYRQPHLVSSVQFVGSTNVFDLTYKLFYTTTLTDQVVPLQTELRFVNTQQQIYVSTQDTQIQIKEANQTNNITSLGNSWYEGQGYKFELNGTDNGISLIEPLTNLADPYQPFDQKGKQMVIINQNILITLYEQRFSAIDPRIPTFTKSYPFKDPHTTVSIVYNKNGYMYFQLLNNMSTKYEILAAQCENDVCSGNNETFVVKGLVTDIQIINQTMFVIYQNNEIEVYYLEKIYQPKQAILLGTENINVGDKAIKILHISNNFYHIYSNNDQGFLNIIQITTSGQDYQRVQLQSVDLLTIANEEYYLPYQNNKAFPYLDIISKVELFTVISVKVLFYSTNDKHLGFDFTFVCDETNCRHTKSKLVFVLAGYTQIVGQPLASDQLVVIPYQVNDQVLMSVYNLATVKNYNIHGLISFIGAVKILKPTQLQYTIKQTDNETALLFYDDDLLQYYQINDGLAINMNGKIDEQQFQIKVSSDFDNGKAAFTIKIVGDNVIPDEPKSLMWLWITLGVVGVLIIGGLGYYFYKKNPKTEEEKTLI